MGGFVVMNTGLSHLESFGELYIYSSGYFPNQVQAFEDNFKNVFEDPKLNAELLRVPLYMAAGETDIALLNAQRTLSVMNKYGVRNFWVLSTGGHEWTNWRRYLHQTAQIMFPASTKPKTNSAPAFAAIPHDAAAELVPTPGAKMSPAGADKTIGQADVTAERVGDSIPVSAIGEPVSVVKLSSPRWVEADNGAPAYATVDGSMLPIDPKAKPISFRVLLPAKWSRRAAQLGGGGMNGWIPPLDRRELLRQGFVTYGSDSGHQAAWGPPGRSGAGEDWALNDEAIRNLGYMQMKKTHDAAMVIIARVYGERPRFTYYIGGSQGGREGLMVAQRYPADYDGIVADVPILSFSSLMLAPELIRIKEKPLANWVTRAKVNAIRAEFIRQADKLDGLADGIINNYMAARALFDVSGGPADRNPWAALRAPSGIDANPNDTSAAARLTDGQIETLKFVYSRYKFSTPLANGVRSFGMWLPNTDPGGSGLIADVRYRGQEGAVDNAPIHSHLGVLGVTGFLMRDLRANPLDYVEGGTLNKRREQISEWLDATNPDLSAFYRRGGKMIVTIGTNDTLASPGAQLDYFQSVLNKMGRDQVDAFARFFVIPQAGHGLSGSSYRINGDGQAAPTTPIPNNYDRLKLIAAWVEENQAPAKTLVVTAGRRSLPLCSYPNYPKYVGGPPESAESYVSAAP
ncbi:MAG: tannase/feruloyl esterase family alpha/beta hydrolase [Thermoguttaceae bacterium]